MCQCLARPVKEVEVFHVPNVQMEKLFVQLAQVLAMWNVHVQMVNVQVAMVVARFQAHALNAMELENNDRYLKY